MIKHFKFLDLDSKLVCSTPFRNWKYYLNLNTEMDNRGERKRERENKSELDVNTNMKSSRCNDSHLSIRSIDERSTHLSGARSRCLLSSLNDPSSCLEPIRTNSCLHWNSMMKTHFLWFLSVSDSLLESTM